MSVNKELGPRGTGLFSLPESPLTRQVALVVVVCRSSQGGSRWPPSAREARAGGEAGRADRVLGRMLFHIHLWSREARRRERPDVVDLLQDQREQA